jgi:hypothetical protein
MEEDARILLIGASDEPTSRTITGKFVIAKARGAPCSGSANMRETRGGVDFFDLGKDLRTDGDDGGLSERLDKRRREELIDGTPISN